MTRKFVKRSKFFFLLLEKERREGQREREREGEREREREGEGGREREREGGRFFFLAKLQRLAWPLRKDDTQIREAFQKFLNFLNLGYKKGGEERGGGKQGLGRT